MHPEDAVIPYVPSFGHRILESSLQFSYLFTSESFRRDIVRFANCTIREKRYSYSRWPMQPRFSKMTARYSDGNTNHTDELRFWYRLGLQIVNAKSFEFEDQEAQIGTFKLNIEFTSFELPAQYDFTEIRFAEPHRTHFWVDSACIYGDKKFDLSQFAFSNMDSEFLFAIKNEISSGAIRFSEYL